jgi:hypothetical protein
MPNAIERLIQKWRNDPPFVATTGSSRGTTLNAYEQGRVNRLVKCADELDTLRPVVEAMAEALRAMQTAADEIAIEFIQHKRATNWGVVNDAYMSAERALAAWDALAAEPYNKVNHE